jgi:hypothetical protein
MKKKKIYLASFFVALFLFVLAGCGQKAQNVPAKKVTASLTNTKTIQHFSFMAGAQVRMRRLKWRMPQKRLVQVIRLFKQM